MQGVKAIPSNEEFAALCFETGGNISAIARRIGVSRTAVTVWVNDNDPFRQSVQDAREAALDLAEDRAMQLIAGIPHLNDKGETVAWTERPDSGLIKFVLATRGRSRGYSESLALTGPNNGPIQVERKVNYDDLSDEELDAIIARGRPAA